MIELIVMLSMKPGVSISPSLLDSRGSATIWTLMLLAFCFFVQGILFMIHREKGAPQVKIGTSGEIVSTMPDAETFLPDSLPPVVVESAPTPPAAVTSSKPHRPSVIADLEPVPKSTVSPVPADPAQLSDPLLQTLVAEAVNLRRSGEMAGAIAKLLTAADKFPANPRVLYELASTYEAMGLSDRANENYQHIVAMGSSAAGLLYPIASNRLENGLNPENKPNSEFESLYISHVSETRTEDDNGPLITLRIDVQCPPGGKIQAQDVFIPVKFYTSINGSRIQLDTSQTVESKWVTNPIDWNDPGIESVEVVYRPPFAKDENFSPQNERNYLGYLVELYYQDSLSDVMARPRKLSRFQEITSPPPQELSDVLPETLGGALLDDAPTNP